MNRVVLIGNGFDLAHGLKTSYKDFIQWYWEERVAKLRTEHRNKNSDPLCTIKITSKEALLQSWQSYIFTNGLTHVSNDKLYNILKEQKYICEFSYTSLFFKNINHEAETKNWVDIENEYYKLLVRYVKEDMAESVKRKEIEKLNKDLSLITKLLTEYLYFAEQQEIPENKKSYDRIISRIYESIKPNDIAISAKDIYKTFVEDKYKESQRTEGKDINIESFKHLQRDIFKENTYENYRTPDIVLLLSFNYTDIVKNYVRDDWGGICNYIHGDLEHEGSIIFGYGDELDENYKKITEENDNQLLKNVKSIRYLESENYRNVLQFIESAPFQIYIMGHSCGNSDRTLLNTLFEHKNCVSIKPFYYKRKENGVEKDNYLDIAMNISRNFTDQKLLRERVVNKNYCEELNK
ncbi:MAG: bacteriophage abortive infection AbiH family protein [Paludibacteraceae bacterium]|nr:bacteriophage abortive infection AbiH family protein [Paludibacteraceae bacterium]